MLVASDAGYKQSPAIAALLVAVVLFVLLAAGLAIRRMRAVHKAATAKKHKLLTGGKTQHRRRRDWHRKVPKGRGEEDTIVNNGSVEIELTSVEVAGASSGAGAGSSTRESSTFVGGDSTCTNPAYAVELDSSSADSEANTQASSGADASARAERGQPGATPTGGAQGTDAGGAVARTADPLPQGEYVSARISAALSRARQQHVEELARVRAEHSEQLQAELRAERDRSAAIVAELRAELDRCSAAATEG